MKLAYSFRCLKKKTILEQISGRRAPFTDQSVRLLLLLLLLLLRYGAAKGGYTVPGARP